MVEMIMKKLDLDRDNKISFKDYHDCVMKNPMLLETFGSSLPTRTAIDTFLTTFTPNTHFKHV